MNRAGSERRAGPVARGWWRGARRRIRAATLLVPVLAAMALAACVPDRPVRTAVDRLLVDVPCRAEVDALLDGLDAGAVWIQGPPGPRGAPSYRLPTPRFAEWVALTVYDERAPVVASLTPDGVTRTTFDAGCVAATAFQPREASPEDRRLRFTDEDLRAAIRQAGDRPLVLYVWAPHMPLSPDGWPELAQAADALGMVAVPVLMAHTDVGFAAREAARVGMPDSGLRVLHSNELEQRQAQVHAPSILIFDGEKRVSPVLPGYRNAEGYRRYLEAFEEGGA